MAEGTVNSSLAPEFQHLTLSVVGEVELMGIRQRDLLKIKVLDVNWNALQKASAVFSGLFEFLVTFKKGQPIVRIAESELQAFRDLLHFVDDQNSLDKSHFSVNRWIDLQKMADKFAVIDCLKFCNTELAKLPINCKQLAELYLDPPPYFSTNLRSSQKIKLAEDYIAQIYRDVKRHWREILCLSPPLFNVIMMDSKLEVQDEETILHLCSQWASDQEGRRGFLDENVFKFVRWSYLSIGKVLEAREMIAGQLFDAKERILMAEGGSDEVGILIANVVLEEMANEVLEKIESGIEYHQESAKHNQSVFTLWDTKYSRECNQVLDKFLWCTRSTDLTYMERDYKRDLMYMERDYQRRPIRVNKGVYSEYSTYFELNRNHIRKLLLGQTVESPEFCCCNTQSRFKLFSHCVEIGSENYFGFYVESLEHTDLKNDFTCKFYVFSKKAAKSEVKKDGYVLKHRVNLRSGCVAGSDNLLGLSLVELNSEDSPYFVNKRIFIRVILDTPILTEELDNIIKRLHGSKSGKGRIKVKTAEIQKLFADAENIFLDEPSLLLLNAPIKICGDIRGQYTDLHRIFEVGGYPPSAQYLFLGGYVNRSKQNIETICLLLAYKIKYKNSFYLLRGSQECASMCQECGFDKECKRRFTIRIWETFVECFNSLPVAARVNKKILCMHGGLSKELENLTQIDKIVRPAEVPGRGLLCDLLWADPDRDTQGWGKNDKDATTFGADIVKKFLRKHKLNLICRAHQVVADGYEYFAKKKLLTIFSAPNYLDNNAGAIVSVDKSLECSFQVLEASKNQKLGSSINTKKPATRSCKGEEE